MTYERSLGFDQCPVTTLGTHDPTIWSQWRHRTLEYWRHSLKYPHNSGETDQLQILLLMLLMERMISILKFWSVTP